MREFKTYKADNKVIVTTRYQNKTIKGVAKCAPEDKFDFEVGQQLAEYRCTQKLYDKIIKNMVDEMNYLGDYIEFLRTRLAERADKLDAIVAKRDMVNISLIELSEKLSEN